ncbi:helix-turn-helix domain-containing protein [Roseiarcaceae bacterium H3SJ34-1]|uniref:helix-turn-helix domain-containing protein n=1 Tax=Terripilifer ovatus TaxID=3032367 RepID=UPI003AB96B17|nr:helix-turn-helix domain-containing protein [Roseiarcaceae bacterium H3SJ34-1]
MQDEGRGTIRALNLIRALNIENGASVSRLSVLTGTSRQALYRILNVLVQEGYVSRREDGRFVLTGLVRSLSDGFKDEYWIGEIAAPELEKLQKKVVWPTEIATCHNFSMRLIHTTRRHSPFVIDYGNVGVSVPILRTALGIAYLAHCAPSERTTILRYFQEQPPSPDSDLARNRAKMSRTLSVTRKRGYATRHRNTMAGETYPDIIDTNATIAVPIIVKGIAVASMAITYIASAMTTTAALERHLPDLLASAQAIAKRVRPRPADG